MAVDSDDGWETVSETGSETGMEIKWEKYSKADSSADEEPLLPGVGPDCVHINEVLESDPELKFGFVIYRCTYDSQEKWDRFMKRLNERTRRNLGYEGVEHLFDRIDWCVQEDPKLARASAANVRRRFRKWIKETGEHDYWLGTARFMGCVMVDKWDLNSVLKGPPPSKFDLDGFGSVTLVSLNKKEGETSVGLSFLVPRIYSLWEGCGWKNFAVEDGDVARP